MQANSVRDPVETLQNCLTDATQAWFSGQNVLAVTCRFDIKMFTQTYSDTTCGFPGIGCSAITTAYAILIYDTESERVRVYHNGMFAYELKRETPWFVTKIDVRHVPGQSDFKREPWMYDFDIPAPKDDSSIMFRS